MISFVSVCLFFPLSLFITPGIQLARIAEATAQNDAINYLGRDYAIKRISISVYPPRSILFCVPLCAHQHHSGCVHVQLAIVHRIRRPRYCSQMKTESSVHGQFVHYVVDPAGLVREQNQAKQKKKTNKKKLC